jgi:hypothetical protein
MKRRAVHCTRPGNSLLLTGFASTPDARGDAKSKRIPDAVCSSHLMLIVMLRRLEGRPLIPQCIPTTMKRSFSPSAHVGVFTTTKMSVIQVTSRATVADRLTSVEPTRVPAKSVRTNGTEGGASAACSRWHRTDRVSQHRSTNRRCVKTQRRRRDARLT